MLNLKFMDRFKYLLAALILLLSAGGESKAAVVDLWLRADTITKTMPDGSVVTMWGFVKTDNTYTPLPGEQPSVPGPSLSVFPGDTLNINLKNNLTGPLKEPISIVIPGQIVTMTPTWNDNSTGLRGANLTKRVRSFTNEAAVDGGTASYTWSNFKAGTYLYQSGTHPAVQVQMGLYGGITTAYAGTPAYDNEVTLLFSEIDPALHNAVATGVYGQAGNITSTMYYEPKYFLVNGEPFSYAASPISAGTAGQNTLLRLLNAGVKDHSIVIQDTYMTLYAEDGNLLPYPKRQYSTLLPAGKTMDAIITPGAGYYPVYDRKLALTNAASSPGGMMAYLEVSSATQYNLTVNKTGGGTVTAASLPGGIYCGTGCTTTLQAYNAGTILTLAATPTAGLAFFGWSGACTGTGDCTVTMNAAQSVTATFTPVHTITATAGPGGNISPKGAVQVVTGANQAFSITPNTGYHIMDVLVDGISVGAVSAYTFTNVTAAHTISATFAIDTFTITVAAGTGGIITPSGATTVNYGTNKTFTIAPNAGYGILDLLVDNVLVGITTSYTFSNISASHTISASFIQIPDIKVSLASVSLKRVRLQRTAQKAITIRNQGLAGLFITNAVIVGPDAPMFQLKNWINPATFAAGGGSTLKVLFRPTSKGQKTATLRIFSNDPDTPVVDIPLSGSGI